MDETTGKQKNVMIARKRKKEETTTRMQEKNHSYGTKEDGEARANRKI